MAMQLHILQQYLPQESLPILEKWFKQRPFRLTISKKRTTKFGDYRAATAQLPHRISVNANLNPYAFLITLTHEFAHLLVFTKFGHRVKAHGIEWKTEFKLLMNVLLSKGIFPPHLKTVLQKHLLNPAASSARDVDLIAALKEYDPPSNLVQLATLNEKETFILNDKRLFIKGKKRRTRYVCKEIATQKEYLIHGVAEVLLVSKE